MNVLSLGLGTQSTMLYILSVKGYLPPLDFAVFSDTGGEKPQTYEYLQTLRKFGKANGGPPIYVAGEKNLYRDLFVNKNNTSQRMASIPMFTESENGGGMLRRQCKNEYKIMPIDRLIRSITKYPVNLWMGMSLDEAERMGWPQKKWKTHIYPFCGYWAGRDEWGKLSDEAKYVAERYKVKQLYEYFGMPLPDNSLCFFCPYMSDAQWAKMQKNQPELFEKACELDETLRDSSQRGIKQKAYIHKSKKPLRDVKFDKHDDYQLFNCTSGNCGT